MATKAEVNAVYAGGLIQGITLVTRASLTIPLGDVEHATIAG